MVGAPEKYNLPGSKAGMEDIVTKPNAFFRVMLTLKAGVQRIPLELWLMSIFLVFEGVEEAWMWK